jgi:hypothetical protein
MMTREEVGFYSASELDGRFFEYERAKARAEDYDKTDEEGGETELEMERRTR